MRPCASPSAFDRWAWLSISPGTTVPDVASTMVPRCRSSRCGATSVMRAPSIDDVDLVRTPLPAVPSNSRAACTVIVPVVRRGVHDHAGRDVADAAVGQRHQPKAIGDLVEEAARVAGPRRRAGQVLGEAARRPDRRPVAGHRIGRERAIDDGRHLPAVGRPHRAEVLAHADRLVRHRVEPAIGGKRRPSPPASVSGATATHSTWLVPSRNRDE